MLPGKALRNRAKKKIPGPWKVTVPAWVLDEWEFQHEDEKKKQLRYAKGTVSGAQPRRAEWQMGMVPRPPRRLATVEPELQPGQTRPGEGCPGRMQPASFFNFLSLILFKTKSKLNLFLESFPQSWNHVGYSSAFFEVCSNWIKITSNYEYKTQLLVDLSIAILK